MPVRILGDIVTPGGVLRNATLTAGDRGLVEEIAQAGQNKAVSNDLDATGRLIVPGFIDVHVHGAGGADFMDGEAEAVRQVARTHARFGTTTLLATTLTATGEHISRCINAVRSVMNDQQEDEARIAGIHLEGPYICAAKRGAQPLEPIRPPDWGEMQRWIAESGGTVKQITMAPEVDGALGFIRQASAAGVVVSIGHTNASYEQAKAGIEAGATHATHLFNAMTPLTHRAPGVPGAALESDRVHVEIIADGVHLHPAVIQIAVRAKGEERVVLITDAMSGAAMPDGTYSLAGNPVIVKEGSATYEDGTLAGSVLTMNRAFANIQKFAGLTPNTAARLAAANAARQIGIDSWTGTLEVGKRADLAVVDPVSGDVEATMLDGRWIYRR